VKDKDEQLKEIIGEELYKGLKQLTDIEPILKSIMNFNNEKELCKNLSAAIIILIDMHTTQLNEVIKFLKANASTLKMGNSGIDPLSTLRPSDIQSSLPE